MRCIERGSLPGRYASLHIVPRHWFRVAARHEVDGVRSLVVGFGPFLLTLLREIGS